MLRRHPAHGQKLDVAGLNEITVLIDRSETELTEVAINSWTPGQDGPPHAHSRKEQNFLVISGYGEVTIGDEKFAAAPGDFFYVPASVVHQTIGRSPTPLAYFLFNAFLDTDKEGHASFADHIDRVKETRRKQAEQQSAAADTTLAASSRPGLKRSLADASATGWLLLPRAAAQRSEAIAWRLAAGDAASVASDPGKEQTLYVYSGTGTVRIGGELAPVETGHTLYVPRGSTSAVQAGADGLTVVSFGTVVAR